MRVLVADDQSTFLSAVRLLLEQEPDVTIVAEVADAVTLLTEAAELHPDLVLLDWELPGMTSNRGRARVLFGALHASCPNIRIIVLSGRPEAGRHAVSVGADSFVSKAEPPERLLAALRQAKANGAQ